MSLEVPKYDEAVVRAEPLPGPPQLQQAPLEAFGGGAGAAGVTKATQNLAEVGGQINEKEFSDAADMAVRDYVGRMSAEETRIKLKAQQLKGSDAFGATEQALKEFDKSQQAMGEEITNPIIKSKVLAHGAEFRNSLAKETEIHAAEQREVYDKSATAALVKNERDAAVTSYLDPDSPYKPSRVTQAIARQRAAVADQMKGQAPDTIKAAQAIEESKTNSMVLDRMISSGNDALAKKFYEVNQTGFYGDDKIDAEKKLEVSSTLGESQRQATSIMAPYLGTDTAGKPSVEMRDEESALKEARKITDPKTQEKTVDLIKERFQEKKRIDQENYQKQAQAAADIVEQYGTTDQIPYDLKKSLKRTDLSALDARAMQIRKKEEPVTVWPEWTKLKDMAADETTRQKFLDIPPANYRPYLADTEYKEIMNIRDGFIKGDDKTISKMKGYRSIGEIVNGTLTQSDFGDMSDSDNKVAKEAIERTMDEEVKTYQSQNKGENPDSDWVQKKIDGLVTKTVTQPGWIFDSKEYGYKTSGEYLKSSDKVPAGDRQQIEAALRKKGMVPTPRLILEMYTEGQKQKSAGATDTPSRARFVTGSNK